MDKITYLKEYTDDELSAFAEDNGLNFEDDGTFETSGTVGKFKDKYSDETKAVFIMNGGNSHGAVWRCIAVDKSISQSGEYES